MEAPDKIYIPTILTANTVAPKDDGGIEYIRKDALLEWLMEMYENNRSEFQQFILSNLIDKINSL